MKNIAISINSLGKGGAEKQSLLLADTLSKKHKVTLIVFDSSSQELILKNNLQKNFKLVFLNGNILNKALLFHKILKKNQFDILFSYLALTNLFTAIIGKINNVKYCIGGIRSVRFRFDKLILQRLLHNYLLDYSIINNFSGVNYFEKSKYDIDKIIVIPNGIDFNQRPPIRVDRELIKILTVARFVEPKDYFTAISSVKYLVKYLIKNNDIKIEYTIVGYGILEKKIKDFIKLNGLDNVFKVVINPTNVSSYYEDADIFILTSLFEGTSNSVMEALANALPVIATNVGDNKYLVQNDFNGYLEKIKDYKGIATSLYELIKDSEKRIAFGMNSYKHIFDKYSTDKFEKRYLDFIQTYCN